MGLTIGAESVLERYGSPLKVAEAVLEGRMDSYDQKFVWEICPKNSPMWEAAKIRLEIKLKLRAAGPVIPDAEIVETEPPRLPAKRKLLR
jgi:hypothetical protein